MLINISNHPVSTWGQKQIDAARQLYKGEIIDFGFPVIDPQYDNIEILKIVKKEVKKVMDLIFEKNLRPGEVAVHVMGEMTCTFAIVSCLQNLGVTCVASTTLRAVTMEANGEKTSVFEFVRFREYSG